MADVVVDSSVAAKWLLVEPDTPQAFRVFDAAVAAGDRLIVLDLAIVEITNVIWKQLHLRRVTRPEAGWMIDDLHEWPVVIEPADRLLRQGFGIAADYDRSVYDALFVALAADLGLAGVTADQPLHGAVRAKYPNVVLLRDWP